MVSTGAGGELESPYTERYILGWVCAGAGVDCECGGQQNVKVTCLINILSGLGGWKTKHATLALTEQSCTALLKNIPAWSVLMNGGNSIERYIFPVDKTHQVCVKCLVCPFPSMVSEFL